MIDHFHSLGITSVELLPVHAFATEPRLAAAGLANYWGYNSLNFFTPHAAYATAGESAERPEAVLREFKGMVEASSRGRDRGHPRRRLQPHLRGGPRRAATRACAASTIALTTARPMTALTSTSPGAATPSNTLTDAASRIVLDSLRYWANDVQVDGFRFDLAATLGP